MDALPQRAPLEGFWASPLPGVPVTPMAGVKTQPGWVVSALTEDVKARRSTEAETDLKSISITSGWKYEEGKEGEQETDCVERALLEWKKKRLKCGDDFWKGPWPSFYTWTELEETSDHGETKIEK
jgi:hypothetical protein